jgi:hypothetical protein
MERVASMADPSTDVVLVIGRRVRSSVDRSPTGSKGDLVGEDDGRDAKGRAGWRGTATRFARGALVPGADVLPEPVPE